ncbi:MAG TPA: DUF72 domain-containing protein [Opitutaceae bacterium]|nr:DUF72 domain-containing protein [Opitutaceae bacterium]
MKPRGIRIGTSGWVYKEWAGYFYPKGWPKKNEFAYYVRHFPTVEINATFYRLPTPKMVRGWREKSPDGFLFAVKGSRFLTHIKRLKDTGRGLLKYFRRLEPLRDRTGPVLWQLPPTFTKNAETLRRLARFLAKLPREYRHAVEFRHPSWMDEETFALLRRHNIANVWISSLKMPADHALTADFAYLRFHGLHGGAYHDYTEAELRPWAEALVHAARKGVPAYVYFNNDLNTRAPLNAHTLMKLVGRHAVAPFATYAATPPDIALPVKKPETWRPWTRASKRTRPARAKISRRSPGTSAARRTDGAIASRRNTRSGAALPRSLVHRRAM